MSLVTKSQWQLANVFTGHRFLLKVAFERISWVPTGLKHKLSETACVQEPHKSINPIWRDGGDQRLCLKGNAGPHVSKAQRDKCNQRKVKAYQLSGVLYLMLPSGAGESGKYMSEENGSLYVAIWARNALYQNIFSCALRVLLSVGLNSDWSYERNGAL